MDNRDIWVIAECKDGVLRESSTELFTAAKTVTDVTGGGITCVLLGAGTMAQAAKEAAAYGAGRVICAEGIFGRALYGGFGIAHQGVRP